MFDKNSLPFGLIISIVIPALFFGVLYGLFEVLEMLGWVSDSGFRPMFRERTTSILAIGMNAIMLNKFQKNRRFETIRGLVIGTVILVAAWVVIFGKHVF